MAASACGPPSGSAGRRRRFIVGWAGVWLEAPCDDAAAPVAGEHVLDLLDIAPGAAVTAEARPSAARDAHTGAGDRIRPAAAFVAELVGGRLVVESADGTRVALDRRAAFALDRFHGASSVAELVATLEVRASVERSVLPAVVPWATIIDDLIACGLVLVDELDPQTDPSPALEQVPATHDAWAPVADGERVPVYAVYVDEVGPWLALGMLTSALRHHDGGALGDLYEIRRPESVESFLADAARRQGPAVLLCSNYVWSVAENLEAVERARALGVRLLVVHGGPSTPKYDADLRAFLAQDPQAVAVHGEGEDVLTRILEAAGGDPDVDRSRFASIPGLSWLDDAGELVRTGPSERIADLDRLPSPYLSGEFDHLPVTAWPQGVTFETNRGCPYGCTFCDWGSVTLSRVRKFDSARVAAEMTWAARRGITTWMLADANFGIYARDVEIASCIAGLRREHGAPVDLGFTVAKNTTRHLVQIFDALVSAGVAPHCSLSLQTTDPTTLAVLDRENIHTDHYLALADAFRQRGLPVVADLMVGLPGQTPGSFRADLQFLVDHELVSRIWPTQLLANAPMNDPEYRTRHRVVADDRGIVRSTATFDADEGARMYALRAAYTAFEQYGILRHVLRFAQADHGVPAVEVLEGIVAAHQRHPERYPLLAWLLQHFHNLGVPPVGWRDVLEEAARFLVDEFGLPDDGALGAVVDAQAHLLPRSGRSFPDALVLPHDVVAYVDETSAWRRGASGGAPRPLRAYPPGVLTVFGDPQRLCSGGMGPVPGSDDDRNVGVYWITGNLELDSPLVRRFPVVVANGGFRGLRAGASDVPVMVATASTSP